MRKQLFRILILNEISRLLSRNKFLISLRTRPTQQNSQFFNRILQLIKGRIKLDAKSFSPRKREREREREEKNGKQKKKKMDGNTVGS